MRERRVLLHCNAGGDFGMGHLVRTVALADAARRRGWAASVVGEIGEGAVAAARLISPGVQVVSEHGAALADTLLSASRSADVVHLDSYWDVPSMTGSAALTSNMQDGVYGVRNADIAIDGTLGGERSFAEPGRSRVQMAGIDLAVIRDQVLRQRGAHRTRSESPRLLIVMGGTDPQGLTARVLRALERIDRRLRVTVVDTRDRDDVRAAAVASSHDVDVIGFVADLPALATHHDLVVTAAGTSVWDFACMGAPMALVCAVDNQRGGYREMVSRHLAIGLGEPPHAEIEDRVAALAEPLAAQDSLRSQATRLTAAVDGLGTWRIVSAWEQLLEDPPASEPGLELELVARSATIDDARILFDWRNDRTTREASRDSEEVEWNPHLSWLTRTLADEARRLLVIESAGVPVATCRWDHRGDADWEVSITVAPHARGRGLASGVLTAAERALDIPSPVRMLAVVRAENEASTRLFRRAGYLPHLPANPSGFLTSAKWRLAAG